MTALAWLALAGMLICLPAPSATHRRLRALVDAGRLPDSTPDRRRRRPSLGPMVGVPAGGLGAAAAAFGGLALGVAALAGLLATFTVVRSAASRRRTARQERALLAAVRLLATELEAGSRPPDALAAAAASTPEYATAFGAAAAAAADGDDVAAALLDHPDLQGIGYAWRVAQDAGAPLAEVLGRLAADLAARRAQGLAVATALAGPRSSAVLLAGLPVLGLALGATLGAQPLDVLFGTPGGRLVCAAGVVLDAAGVWWTQRLITRAESA